MDPRRAPALLPAAGLLAGTCLALHLAVPWPTCVLLLALGLSLGRRGGWTLACLAIGFLNAEARWLDPRRGIEKIEPARPVEVVGRIVGHPISSPDALQFRVRAEVIEQRRQAVPVVLELLVRAPAAAAMNVPAPALGAEVRIKGHLGRSAGFANAPGTARGPWRLRVKSRRFLTVTAGSQPRLAVLASKLRQRVEALLAARPVAHSPLVRALLLGDRSRLPRAQQQVLRRLGLAHILAVSGLHVGIVAVGLLLVASPLPRSVRFAIAFAGVGLYLMVVGPRPSVMRASMMGGFVLLALLCERPPQAPNALACVVAILVLEWPGIVVDLGFQLSVAATFGIVTWVPVLDKRWGALPRSLRQPLAASLAAQAATWPWLVPLTGGWHPLAAVYNLLAVPWLSAVLAASWMWLLVTSFAPAGAIWLEALLKALLVPLTAATNRPPTVADFQLLADPYAAGWILAVTVVAAGLWPRPATVGLLGAALLVQTGGGSAPAPVAEILALDVGQGDALVVRDGSRALLVDGGGWREGDIASRVLLPALGAAGIRRLDAVMMSHADLDHCGGLRDLVRYLPVAEVLTPPPVGDEPPEGCAGELLAAPGPRHRWLARGDQLRLGRWRLQVLHPGLEDRGGANDRSLVILAELEGDGRRALLTGDLEARGEGLLLRRGDDLRADVLKVAHHGSKSSTTSTFLAAVQPRLALISAGPRNPYGHPAPPVLERLATRGVRILRTDRAGLVRLRFVPRRPIQVITPAAPRPNLD